MGMQRRAKASIKGYFPAGKAKIPTGRFAAAEVFHGILLQNRALRASNGWIYGNAVVSLYGITIMTQRFTSKKPNPVQLTIRYNDEVWRFAAAFVAAVATGLVAYPREPQGTPAVTHFLALVAVYFFMAYVALLWVRTCTVLLDRRFPWPRFPSSRLAFQLLCCWLLPVLLVYALAHSVLSLPQLAPLTRGNADSRETAVVLVLSLALSCNIAYICVYFMVLCRRLQQKAQQGLRLVWKAREQQQAYEAEIDNLRQALRARETEDRPERMAARTLPDNPLDGQYRHVTPFKTELLDYREISEFVLLAQTVFVCREGWENEAVKQRSLKAVELVTDGYFRKISRTRAIPHHRLKRCVARGSQMELTLFPNGEVIVVSEGYAAQIRGWVLSLIGIEREVGTSK